MLGTVSAGSTTPSRKFCKFPRVNFYHFNTLKTLSKIDLWHLILPIDEPYTHSLYPPVKKTLRVLQP